MYKKEEASQLRLAFWTTFGHYMAPVPSSEGMKVNWPNYKTGIKNMYFRLRADAREGSIAIEVTHPDPGIQELYFEQFIELKPLLHQALDEEWKWALHTRDEHGKTISRVYQQIGPVSVYKREDWPALISFFKPRLLALDVFWSDARYAFENLK
jgi:hypothetical protein